MSCDEALVDLSDIVTRTKLKPEIVAAEIRKHVKEATGCNCSAGRALILC